MKKTLLFLFSLFYSALLTPFCESKLFTLHSSFFTASAQNPYMPLWEFIPDGEPYVFEDPDCPGKYRVYVYGSHDNLRWMYCGRDQVVWSAPVDDLTNWRYDGLIFKVSEAPNGEKLNADGACDVLFAPDVAVKTGKDGRKTYYLYPNNQGGGRNTMIAKSDRPDGPFQVCNWSKEKPTETYGCLGFDPAVLIDDDGRVYGYWGFETSNCAELDPETMCSVKPGTKPVTDMVSGCRKEGVFRFFEASSIRKIEDKYVFIYSRTTFPGEFGLANGSNYTLAYAYSDKPMGPWTYGGTIIDARARETDEQGNVIASAMPGGNTHGSICKIGSQWYVFYHRQIGLDCYARQAMVAPIDVKVEKGKGGKVMISEAEYTSEGFLRDGLDPTVRQPAGLACWTTGPEKTREVYPKYVYSGSYIKPVYPDSASYQAPYNCKVPFAPVVNNTAGSIVGYKYMNMDKLSNCPAARLQLRAKPEGVSGRIKVMIDSPWKSRGGVEIGSFALTAAMPQTMTELTATVNIAGQKGKHALYFVFESDTKGKSLCEMYDFLFLAR
ncbi:MAG: family 43 glycosylhydrolase [Bacteroidaceae bacterium]|nr:family 43 glycosylhydrolase [Bacteroidaceae bacterium]